MEHGTLKRQTWGLTCSNLCVHISYVVVSEAPPKPGTPPQIICEKRWEPSDELKSVAPPLFSPLVLVLSLHADLRILVSANPAAGGGELHGEEEEEEGQDQQPPGLAARCSSHSWEGRRGVMERRGGGKVGCGEGVWRGRR